MTSKLNLPDELYADLVLLNGKIITVNPDESIVEAVACKDKKIVKVGNNDEVKNYIGKHTDVIDLKGKTVVPGFIESHLHFNTGATWVRFVNLCHVRSMDELVNELRKKAEKTPSGRWIQGWGYPYSKMKEKRQVNRYDLDRASTEHPISVRGQEGHDGIRLNSLGLELAGISKATPDPELPSLIERDPKTGEPLGNLREKPEQKVLALIAAEPLLTKEEMKEGIRDTIKWLHSFGITSIQEPGAPMDILPIYQQMLNEGEFTIRNTFLIAAPTLGRSYKHNESYRVAVNTSIEAGYWWGFGNDHLKFAGIKLGHDGSMSAGNCAVYEPYLNYPTPDNYGVVHGYTNEELNDGRALAEFSPIVIKLHKAGLRCGIGAIGDRGIDFFLDALELAYNEDPDPTRRHSIEHCSLPTKKALERMVKMGITASCSIGFGWELGNQHRAYLGMERMQRYMPMKTFKEKGIVASGNFDWFITTPNIVEGIHVCVNRTTETGQDLGQSQRISVMDAIKAFTWNGAYITGEEDIKGSIELGKYADFAVLDKDILTCDPAEIHMIKVLTTIVDGKVVYQKDE